MQRLLSAAAAHRRPPRRLLIVLALARPCARRVAATRPRRRHAAPERARACCPPCTTATPAPDRAPRRRIGLRSVAARRGSSGPCAIRRRTRPTSCRCRSCAARTGGAAGSASARAMDRLERAAADRRGPGRGRLLRRRTATTGSPPPAVPARVEIDADVTQLLAAGRHAARARRRSTPARWSVRTRCARRARAGSRARSSSAAPADELLAARPAQRHAG